MTEEEYSSEAEEEGLLVNLGFAEEPEHERFLRRHFFPSKIGGQPAWLDPVHLPSESRTRCATCGGALSFLLQLYAPINGVDDAFHRTLFVFACSKEKCIRQNQGVVVLRSQLPRKNPYYGFDPCPESQEYPTLPRGVKQEPQTKFLGPWRELELVTDAEPEEEEGEGATGGGSGGDVREKYREMLTQKLASSSLDGGGERGDDEEIDLNEMDENMDDQWAQFQTRVSRAPTQCIRYCNDEGSSPLWPTLKNTPKAIPKCGLCGEERQFEFQVLPQVLYYAGVDSDVPDELDFTSVAVYTCFCTLAEETQYAEEYAWTQCI